MPISFFVTLHVIHVSYFSPPALKRYILKDDSSRVKLNTSYFLVMIKYVFLKDLLGLIDNGSIYNSTVGKGIHVVQVRQQGSRLMQHKGAWWNIVITHSKKAKRSSYTIIWAGEIKSSWGFYKGKHSVSEAVPSRRQEIWKHLLLLGSQTYLKTSWNIEGEGSRCADHSPVRKEMNK